MPDAIWMYINGSSKVICLDKLRNTRTPGYLNNATVTLTLADKVTGVAVEGEDWPVTLAYVTGSDGRYEATLDYAIEVTDGQRLSARCVAVHGDLQRPWVRDVLVVRG